MFIHFGLYSIPARGEWVMFEKVKIKDYEKLMPHFKPRPGVARQWARLAREAGMRYMVLTTKHHDGFCLFDSKLTKYNAIHAAARRDLVREYADACRSEGLHVGFYYSILDWHHPNYPFESNYPLVRLEPAAHKPDRQKYLDYKLGQLRELMTNYGKIDILWFDGRDPVLRDNGKFIAKEIRRYQPNILINNRLVGNEPDFVTPEQTTPREPPLFNGRKIPWEVCHTMTGQSWGYSRHECEADFRSAGKLIQMLTATAGAGGNFLLNVGPRADGSLRPEEVNRLRAIGKWMKKNGTSIYGVNPAAQPLPAAAKSNSRAVKPDYTVIKGRPIAVSADIDEEIWRKTPAIHVSQDANYDASRERYPAAARYGYCAYDVRAMHAGGMLYLIVDVESETRLSRPGAKYMLNCDAVRFLFAANTCLPRINYTPESFEISIDVAGNVWMPNESTIPGAVFRHAVKPSARGYVVMLALPLSMMRRRTGDPKSALRPGDQFKFNIVVIQPSPPMMPNVPRKSEDRPNKSWWLQVPPNFTPYGERHRVYWKGHEGDCQMFNVQSWGVLRLK